MKLKGFIERQKVYDVLNGLGGCGAKPESFEDGWDKAIGTAIFDIVEIPAADVVPVVHGEWIYDFNNNAVICSACEHRFDSSMFGYNHCPICGAAMETNLGYEDFPEIYEEGDHELKCEECGKTFMLNTHVSYSWETEKKKDGESK